MGSVEEKVKKNIHDLDTLITERNFLDQFERKIRSKGYFDVPISLIEANAEAKIREMSLFYAKELVTTQFKALAQLLQKSSFIDGNTSSSEALEFFNSFLKQQFKTLLSPNIQKVILNIKKPLLNHRLEQFIRAALRINNQVKILDTNIQVLCLSAFLHPLRQTVGSCFATAPAIQIQREQPLLFFKDLIDLLNLGQLKRVNEGVEQNIPMSFAFVPGILKKQFKIKSLQNWQFSLEGKAIAEREDWFEKCTSKEEKNLVLSEKFRRLPLDQTYSLEELIIHFLLNQPKRPSRSQEPQIIADHLNTFHIHKPLPKEEEKPPGFLNLKLYIYQLYDNLLLKSWEYTMASFSESKVGFYKWNLYTSLGLSSDSKDGIGEAVFQYLEQAVERGKQEVEDLHRKYEEEFYQVKFLESRLKNAESTQMEGWARLEYQNHINEMNRLLNAREDRADWVEKISKVMPKLIEALDELFPKYFQELYDAEMQDFSHAFYQDAAAGFRLIYKHGRADPSVWTAVETEEEFVQVIKDFFLLVENEIKTREEFEGLDDAISEIITVIVRQLQNSTFIEGAFERVCQRYKYPYHPDKPKASLPYKPWSYLSGGTLTGLLHHYYQREKDFTIVSQKVASPIELCSFLIDSIRELSPNLYRDFLDSPSKALLMTSKNHAFLFQPGLMPFREIWEERNLYSYTWIRDEWLIPSQTFIQSIEVKPIEMTFFIETYLSHNPYLADWFRTRIHWPNYALPLSDFKKLCCQYLPELPSQFLDSGLCEDLVDSWIYEFFPFTTNGFLKSRIREVFKNLPLSEEERIKKQDFLDLLIEEKHSGQGLSSLQLFELIKSAFLIYPETLSKDVSLSRSILKSMQQAKVSMPDALYWADTNWPFFHFAFFLDLKTLQPSLWRMERWGRKGFPMHVWNSFFKEQEPSQWNIYMNPSEYTYNDSNPRNFKE